MPTFQIQNSDGTLSRVSHKEFFETIKGDDGYLYYNGGGRHIAMLPTSANTETLRICRQMDNAENDASVMDSRCRDVKGNPCRYQHDTDGRVIRNVKNHPVRAKCGDCPRDGWTGGKRENCCIRNYCQVKDCTYCMNHREYHAPVSIDWPIEDKCGYCGIEHAGFNIADPDVDILAELESGELNSALHIAISQLTLPEQEIISAVYWDRLSLRVFAAKSGMSKNAAYRLHSDALESLKDFLKDFR